MTISLSGTFGRPSVPQSKPLATTTDRGTSGALSLVCCSKGWPGTWPWMARAPAHLPVDGAGVGVQQQLLRIAAHPRRRVPRAVHAIAVALAGADAGHVAVPGMTVHLRQVQATLAAGLVEQAQLDALGDPTRRH